MEILTLFIIKLVDQFTTTTKSIYIAKEKYLIGAILNAICTALYFILIVKVTQSNSPIAILIVSAASFIGTYLSGTLIKKSEPDKLFVYRITSESFDNGKLFADEIRNNNIAIHTSIIYDKNQTKNLLCEVYCKTKQESKLVRDMIPTEFKYHVNSPME